MTPASELPGEVLPTQCDWVFPLITFTDGANFRLYSSLWCGRRNFLGVWFRFRKYIRLLRLQAGGAQDVAYRIKLEGPVRRHGHEQAAGETGQLG